MTNSRNSVPNTESRTLGAVSLVSTLFDSPASKRLSNVKDLLTASISGQQDIAEAFLREDPSLALEKLEENDFVTAPTGHRFNLKAYQAAWAVRDFEMAKMIKSYLDRVEAIKQLNEFEKGVVVVNEKLIFKQLYRLADTIYYNRNDITTVNFGTTVKKDSLIEQDLHTFWRLLDATLDEVITIGKKPFIPDLLLSEALQLYLNHYQGRGILSGYNKIDYFSDPRTWLFVQRVLGYDGIQRIMPVNFIQAFSVKYNSYHPVRYNPQQFLQNRFTQFGIADDGSQVDFYPLQPRSSKNFDLFIRGVSIGYLSRGETYITQEFLSELMSAKKNEMAELMPESTHLCVLQ